MKTEQDVDVQTMPSAEPQRGRGRWGMLVALLVVVLIVGASAAVFAQLARQRGNPSSTGVSAPPTGQWVAVLSNYEISSLVASPADPNVLYACALPLGSKGGQRYTILRSSDAGTNWQNMGNTFGLGSSCDLAVNPANSSDLYVAGNTAVQPTASNAASYMLWHSSDGGQTWTAILPSLSAPTPQQAAPWQVQQLSMEGSKLYGIQWFPASKGVVQPRTVQPQSRLVMSADGGHSWTVVDSHFVSASLSVRGYAVDASNTRTLYELVATSFLPFQPGMQPANTDVQPAFSSTVSLYKTTDGGSTWRLLVSQLPYTTQLQLASANPQVLYLGGAIAPLPYIPKVEPANPTPAPFGYFQLRVSTDGGATWKMATSNTQLLLNKGWFVGPAGRAFLAANQSLSSSSPTAATAPVSANPSIKSYDPATGKWGDVTTAPASGVLIALTPTVNNGAVLWLLASSNTSNTLYRYVA